jgi:F-type H+-transporting ATPase subunit a
LWYVKGINPYRISLNNRTLNYNITMNTFSHQISPLDQFEIRDLLSLEAPILANSSISVTNIGLYLTIGGGLIFMLNLVSTNDEKIESNG